MSAVGSEGQESGKVSFLPEEPGEDEAQGGSPADESEDEGLEAREEVDDEEPEVEPEASGEEDAEDEPADDDSIDLFADTDDEDSEDEEPIPDDGKPVSHETHVQRIRAIGAKRDQWRDRAQTAERELAEAREELESAGDAPDDSLIGQLYSGHENPGVQVQADKASMDLLERHASDPRIAPVVRMIQHFLNTGEEKLEMMGSQEARPQTPPPKPSEAAEPKTDPRVERMVRKDVASQANEILESGRVLPSFRKIISRAVSKEWDTKDDPTAEAVEARVKDYIQANGLSKDIVAPKGSARRRQPPTGSRRGAATTRARGRESDPDDKPTRERPKTAQEADQQRSKRFQELFRKAEAEGAST